MTSLHAALAGSLGAPFSGRAAAVLGWVEASGLGLTALEASVRGEARRATGARMMVERVPPRSVPGFFDALGVPFGERASAFVDAAARLELSTITGWDASVTPIAKLYVNASDASEDVRRRLADAVGLSRGSAPHVVGLNVGRESVEEKTYVQSRGKPPELEGDLAARLDRKSVV